MLKFVVSLLSKQYATNAILNCVDIYTIIDYTHCLRFSVMFSCLLDVYTRQRHIISI